MHTYSFKDYYYIFAQGHVEYLVLWEGYLVSWVLDTAVTAPGPAIE